MNWLSDAYSWFEAHPWGLIGVAAFIGLWIEVRQIKKRLNSLTPHE